MGEKGKKVPKGCESEEVHHHSAGVRVRGSLQSLKRGCSLFYDKAHSHEDTNEWRHASVARKHEGQAHGESDKQ